MRWESRVSLFTAAQIYVVFLYRVYRETPLCDMPPSRSARRSTSGGGPVPFRVSRSARPRRHVSVPTIARVRPDFPVLRLCGPTSDRFQERAVQPIPGVSPRGRRIFQRTEGGVFGEGHMPKERGGNL